MFMIVVNILSVMIIVIFCRLPSILTHWMSLLVSSNQWKLLRWMSVDLILLHMDHQYKGLHLHSFQMEQRGDELLLMKFKGDYLIENWLPISMWGCIYVVFKGIRGGMSFCLWSLRGDYLIENWLPIRGIIGILMTEPWGNEGSDEFCGITKIFWPSSPLLPGNKQ